MLTEAALRAVVFPAHHPRAMAVIRSLGRAGWLRLARLAKAQPVALGGMTDMRARQLRRASGIMPGWAAIDAWEERAAKRRARQKRKAVPT